MKHDHIFLVTSLTDFMCIVIQTKDSWSFSLKKKNYSCETHLKPKGWRNITGMIWLFVWFGFHGVHSKMLDWFPVLLLGLLSLRQGLIELEARLVADKTLRSSCLQSCCSWELELQAHTYHTQLFPWILGDLNSGPHTCTASTLTLCTISPDLFLF